MVLLFELRLTSLPIRPKLEVFADRASRAPLLGLFGGFVKDWIPLIDEYYYCKWFSLSTSAALTPLYQTPLLSRIGFPPICGMYSSLGIQLCIVMQSPLLVMYTSTVDATICFIISNFRHHTKKSVQNTHLNM